MSMRRENEEQPMGHISIEADISAVVGDFEITDVDVYAVHNGERVVDIPLGASFEIHADYMIINNAATLFDPFWSTSMTVWDLRTELPVGSDDFGDHVGKQWLDAHDAINLVMEHAQAMYRLKIFASHKHGAGSPPQELWR